MDGVELYSHRYFIVVGKALGYPPIASEFLRIIGRTRNLRSTEPFSTYARRYFTGHIKDVEEIAQWLWENVPVPPEPVCYEYQCQIFTLMPDALTSNTRR
jgi:hypothetical protein